MLLIASAVRVGPFCGYVTLQLEYYESIVFLQMLNICMLLQ